MRTISTAQTPVKAAGLASAAIALAAVLSSCASVPLAGGARLQPVTLERCSLEGVPGDVLCGAVDVWENRQARAGRKISLNVVVLKALSPGAGTSALFTFAGGPGQGEASDAPNNARRFARIRATRDIVMIDQRGTGRSNPLNCNLGGPAALVDAFVAGILPTSKVEECRRTLESVADLRLYTTPTAADDVDEVRQRLGYGQIDLYGGSYGSRTALVYLDRYPQNVRTATLRAVFPTTLKNPLYTARDSQFALDQLFADCAAELPCRTAFPSLSTDLATTFSDLEGQPVLLNVPSGSGETAITITRDVFAGLIRRLLYDARSQAAIPRIIARAKAGDYRPLRDVLSQVFGIERSLSMGMFLSVTCSEDVSRIREGEIRHATEGTFLGAVSAQSLISACRSWPMVQMPRQYYQARRSDRPALLFSGALDPMTPQRYAVQAARPLTRSRHLVLEGIAHGPFSECAINIMNQFIDDGSSEQLNLECLRGARRLPFLTT